MSFKISVITVCLDDVNLKRTIESVICQTYSHYEHLIIDGGSTNKITRECLDYYQHHSQIKVSSEKDEGIYDGMNKGILQAEGDYLLFLNAGDVLVDNNVLSLLIDGEDGTVDLIYGDLRRTFTDGSQDVVKMPALIDFVTLMNSTLCHPVTLIKKKLFDINGLYDTRLKIVADWAFFLKVIVLGNASQKHKSIVVSNFVMDGLSSLPENQSLIYKEREWVKSQYLSNALVKLFEEYTLYKQFYNNKWLSRGRKFMKLLNKKL